MFESEEITVKNSVICIIISKSDIVILLFDKKIIQKISMANMKYHDSFLRRCTVGKNYIRSILLWKELFQ